MRSIIPWLTGAVMMTAGALLWSRPLEAAPITVRSTEGSIHGFLALRAHGGALLAQGDLLEVTR